MKKTSLIFAAVFNAILIISACSDESSVDLSVSKLDTLKVSHSMKGWELYSWPQGSQWKFAILAGSNSVKSLAQVATSSNTALIRVTGADSVKLVLNKFPQGESILMIGQGWLQRTWVGQDKGTLQLPPTATVDELKQYCTQKNLTLQVTD